MTAQQSEDVIIARLRTAIATVEVDNMPDRPESYELTHPVGALLVYYKRSNYKREDVNQLFVGQERDIQVAIRIKAHGIKGNDGAISLVQQTITALQGFDISSYNQTRPGRIYIVDDYFLDYSPEYGIWDYEVIVGIPTEQMQDESLL